jgi:hypothetical protein
MRNETAEEERVSRFWDRYLAVLDEQAVPTNARRWYVVGVEEYLRAQEGRRLAEHTPKDVSDYFWALGRQARLESWQMQQSVHALELVFCRLLRVGWCTEVDWGHWMAALRDLKPDHPTLARENRPLGNLGPEAGRQDNEPGAGSGSALPSERETSGLAARSESLGRFTKGSRAERALDAIRAAHAGVLERLITESRRRHDSIRTEQTYELWTCRFIAFHKNASPTSLGAPAVVAFLEYLAVRRNVGASTQNQALNALVFLYCFRVGGYQSTRARDSRGAIMCTRVVCKRR